MHRGQCMKYIDDLGGLEALQVNNQRIVMGIDDLSRDSYIWTEYLKALLCSWNCFWYVPIKRIV